MVKIPSLSFLESKGYDIEDNPNSKINEDQLQLLSREFADSAHGSFAGLLGHRRGAVPGPCGGATMAEGAGGRFAAL